MIDSTTETLEYWLNQLADDQAISLDAIPPELRSHPKIAKLLAFARVRDALDTPEQTTELPERFGAYVPIRLLGSGGMGEVWLAQRADEEGVQQQVAIKRVQYAQDRFLTHLKEERRLLARLDHPAIVRFLDAGRDVRGAPYMVLEYVDGVPISQYVVEQKLPLRARINLFLQVCAAVTQAHSQLIVHRDIKPSNVLVTRAGQPKLLDFGIARMLDANGGNRHLTNSSLTPAYAAPEQLRGEPISTATDVYGLGLLLCQLLTGALPQHRSDADQIAIMAAITNEQTIRASDLLGVKANSSGSVFASQLRGDLDAIIEHALQLQPSNRYGSVIELAADLSRYLQARPVLARRATRWYRASRFIRRNLLGVAAAAALIVAATVSLWQAQRATEESHAAKRELARSERVSAFLSDMYREQDPMQRSAAAARSPAQQLVSAVNQVQRELADDPLSQAQLLHTLGNAQLNLFELAAAHTTLDLAASKAASLHAGLVVADIDALRGALAQRENHSEAAERYFQNALAEARVTAGDGSVAVARIKIRYAYALNMQSRFPQALLMIDSAYQVLLAKLGARHPDTIMAQISLGQTQEQLRNDNEALTTMKDALALVEEKFGAADARLIKPLQVTGMILRRRHDFSTARVAFARAAAIARQQFGAQRNGMLAEVLLSAAGLERDANKLNEALNLLNDAESNLAENDVNSRAQLHSSRGDVFLFLADGVRAEPDLRKALRLRAASGDLKSGITWYTQAQVGEALALQHRFAEAIALQNEAAVELKKLLGPDAYQNSLIAARQARTYELADNWLMAVRYWRETFRISALTYDADHLQYFLRSLRLAGALAHVTEGRVEATQMADALLQKWSRNPLLADGMGELMLLRCNLYLLASDVAAAHALAVSTNARTELRPSDKEIAGLRAIAGGQTIPYFAH
jgi:eukaryotic-like serine/threonine-protein kinase